MHQTILIETQFFPPVMALQKYLLADSICLEACEFFQKGSFRNRCQIATSLGVQTLSVPLKKGKNAQMPIKDVQISYDFDWQRQHWMALKTAYGSAPFAPYYMPQLEDLYTKKRQFLFDWNLDTLALLSKWLKIDLLSKIQETSTFQPIGGAATEGVADWRQYWSPKTVPPMPSVRYAQIFQEKTGFLPHLSGLDLLMCAGGAQAKSLLMGL